MVSRFSTNSLIAFWGFVILCGVAPVSSQELADGNVEIQAQSLTKIPGQARVRFRLANDSDFNMRLGAVAKEALQNAGYRLDDKNPMITLRMETQSQTGDSARDNSIGSLEAGSGVGVDVNVRLWSSTKNSLLNRNANEAESSAVFAVTFDAYDESASKTAWRGEAVTKSSDANNFEAGEFMVRQLISAFGRTMERAMVPLR